MEYWIIINGKALGPYPIADLLGRGLTPSTPVWRKGLDKWTPAGSLDELSLLFAAPSQPQPPSYAATPAPPPFRGPGTADTASQPQPQPQAPSTDDTAMPPTYLGWNIAATVLCCMVAGIVGIIYSAQTRSLYQQGDIEGSRRASRTASIWLIVSIVVGLISSVFYIVAKGLL